MLGEDTFELRREKFEIELESWLAPYREISEESPSLRLILLEYLPMKKYPAMKTSIEWKWSNFLSMKVSKEFCPCNGFNFFVNGRDSVMLITIEQIIGHMVVKILC